LLGQQLEAVFHGKVGGASVSAVAGRHDHNGQKRESTGDHSIQRLLLHNLEYVRDLMEAYALQKYNYLGV